MNLPTRFWLNAAERRWNALAVGLTSAVSLAAAGNLSAQTTFAEYMFDGGSTAVTNSAPNITAGDVAHNAGLTGAGFSSSSNSIFVRTNGTDLASDTAISADTLQLAIDNDLYTSFDFTIDSGTVDLNSLSFDLYMTSFDAANDQNVTFMSDLTGFTVGNELGSASPIGNSAPGLNTQLDLTQFGVFSGLGPQTIEFRIYYWDNTEIQSDIYRVDNIVLSDEIVTALAFDEWLTDGGGDFGTAANWDSDPNVPGVDVLDNNALFGGAITAASTVNVDTNAQLGTIQFDNGSSYTLSGTGILTLTGDAQVIAVQGEHIIEADVAGTDGLTKDGGGDVRLVGAKSYTGDTNIDSGRLRVESLDAIDNTGSSTVNIASGAELVLQGDVDSLGLGAAGDLDATLAGPGNLVLSNTLTTEVITIDSANAAFDGDVVINGGTLAISTPGALGSTVAETNIRGAGQLQVTGGIVLAENLDMNSRSSEDADLAAHLQSTGANTFSGTIIGENGDGTFALESVSGTATYSGAISDANETGTFRFTGAGDHDVTGGISGASVNVEKQGAGTLTLTTGASYGGTTDVKEGTLVVASGNGLLSSSTINVDAGATVDLTAFGNYDVFNGLVTQNYTGSGTIDVNTLTTGEINNFAPGDGQTAGTLTIDGDLVINNSFSSPGTTANLFFDLDNTTTVGSGVNDLIDVTGSVTVTGGPEAIQVNVSSIGGVLAEGTYTLIQGGSVSASAGDFAAPSGTRQAFGIATTATTIDLTVTGSNAQLVWAGAADGDDWDVNTTANWDNGGSSDVFFNLDDVTFDDTAVGRTVELVADVQANSLTVNQTTGNGYRLEGAGGLTGNGAINVQAGSLTLANDNNTFAGPVTVDSGATLVIGNSSAAVNAFPNSEVGITNNGSVVIDDQNGEAFAGAITGTGSVTVNRGIAEFTAANTYTGDTTINAGELRVADGGSIASSNIFVNRGGEFDPTTGDDTYTVVGGQTIALESRGIGFPGAGSINTNTTDPVFASGSRVQGSLVVDGTLSGSGVVTGSVTAQTGSVVEVGSVAIAADAIGTQTTTSEDFEGVAAGNAFTAGASTGLLPGWTFVDRGAVTTDANWDVAVPAGIAGANQALIQTVTNIDFDRDAVDNQPLFGSAAISPLDTSGAVDIISVDFAFDGTGTDGSGNFLDAAIGFGYQDQDNNLAVRMVRGNTGTGGSTELDVSVIIDGDRQNVFDTFDTANFSGGFASDTLYTASVTHDSLNGIVAFEIRDATTDALLYAGVDTDDRYKVDGSVWVGMNNDAATFDNFSVTTQDGLGLAPDTSVLSVNGDFTLDAGATLAVDIFDTASFDLLDVGGTLTANGTLDVNLTGANPNEGDSYDILDFDIAAGSFADILLPALTGGLAWDTSTLLTDGILSVIAGGVIEGDYNGDGFVSQPDLDLVLLNWGDAILPGGFDETAIPGGGPFDSLMSQNELDGVLLNWGNGTPPSPVAAIPEPGALALLGLGSGLLFRRRSR